ncbi:MAG: mechanosensitive ion channel family protein [Cyanobacteria bacterium]|nr:mechanosensitive ion channel family protein [Cyanobacteriota bacterium]
MCLNPSFNHFDTVPLNASILAAIVVPFVFKLLGGLAIWVVGGWLINFAMKLARRAMAGGGNLDPSLILYLVNILAALLKVILVVSILGFFGVQTASFAALLAGAGLAIGAAWSGMLANFAAGVFLMINRPFKVGDFVTGGGVTGVVEEIDMFVTIIRSLENVRLVVPNGKMFGDTIENFSTNPYRRVDLAAQLDITADVGKAIALLKEGIKAVPNQYPGQEAVVELLEFTERGPKLAVRPFVNNEHYWQVYFDTNRMIFQVLSKAGFPVPRLPVHMTSAAN